MTDVREATDDLLAEKPALESDLREVLAVDERTDNWTFDEVPLDSGTFGELVSRDIVVKDGDEYEIADPDAVRASLDGEETDSESDLGEGPSLPSVSLPSVSRVEAGALAGALAFVALMRAYVFPSVFRGEYVVLPSNDPYYYRYWVERLAAEATGVFDFSVLSGLPAEVAKGEPLMVATLWWLTNLLGGADAAGWVLALYPVVSALVVAALTYALVVRLTGDRRVALAAVVLLAVIPAFAYRTGLGFADHHAFDYPWLVLTALSLVWLADVVREDLSDTRRWLAAGVLGVAVAGQVLAWDASPIIIGALGVYVAVRVAADVRDDRSPLVASAPILAGLALASVLSHLAHAGFGWHTDMVAYSPALMLVGVLVVSLFGEAVRQMDMPGFVLGTGEVAGALTGLVLLQTFLPAYASKLSGRVSFLLFKSGRPRPSRCSPAGRRGPRRTNTRTRLRVDTGGSDAGAGELARLPTTAPGVARRLHVRLVFPRAGDVPAPVRRRTHAVRRGTGGYGFVAFVAKLDLTSSPVLDARTDAGGRSETTPSLELPDRGTVTALVVLLLLVSSAGTVQTAVRHEQVKIVDDKFRSSVAMDAYSEQQELEYPDNYVLTKWGRNRMYNYFVNGEAKSYRFAERHYEPFLQSRSPKAQYQKLRDKVGFVVTTDLDVPRVPKDSNYARLHQRRGSAGRGASGSGHYRMMYENNDGSVKAFALVPGARVYGNATSGQTVTISKQVEVDGKSFTYRRKVESNPYGVFSTTVPYAGAYSVEGATMTVPKDAPETGGNVKWHDRTGVAHWPFEKVSDGTAYDAVGGHSATLRGSVDTVKGPNGRAISFDGKNASATANLSAPSRFTVSMWVKSTRSGSTKDREYQLLLKSKNGNFVALSPYGVVSVRVPGVATSNVRAGRVPSGTWTYLAVAYNGTHQNIYVNGQLAGTQRIGNGIVDWGGQLRFGNDYRVRNAHAFEGAIDEVRIDGRALSPGEVQQRYEAQNATRG
ncbi:LamG-like jellyroll fold domain-containing protein [Halorussus aquaticus]|uniref:LamG-like jellyroll fold domain-containing protein n=1 Tax=Halorussus aquaticus TaxID=2953748 RepID=UPI0020B67432|nr:LamG-like jellyroll fold domain-containing protein [Halorussus aquaticus]